MSAHKEKKMAALHARLLNKLRPYPRREIDWEAVRRLIKLGVDVTMNPKRNSETRWPLAWDLAKAPTALLKEMQSLGMPVFPLNSPESVIERAITNGKAENLRLLLETAPAMKWTEKSKVFTNPVQYWCLGNEGGSSIDFNITDWRQMLHLLLASGAELDTYDQWGRTPLLYCLVMHSAHHFGESWIPKRYPIGKTEYRDRALMLIKAGADVNAPHRRKVYELGGHWPIGATPLFVRPFGDGSLHRALLRAGADPTIRCTKPVPWNAIEFAEMHLERLKTGSMSYIYPPTKKRIEFDGPPVKDDPIVVAQIIKRMKRRAVDLGRAV